MVTPYDGMQIKSNTVFTPGVYHLPAGICICADGVTLDGNGALIIGSDRQGYGIHLEGLHNITIKNVALREYQHAIYAQNCTQLTITGCHIAGTREAPPNTLFLDVWLPADQAYGSAIMLRNVVDSTIADNDLQHQMNGLLTYECERLTVRHNIANYCSGWGFHLFGTKYSIFEDNYADFCSRYQPRSTGIGHMGADSAGFLILHNSCNNVFRRNKSRMSGDGFFLGGMTPQFEPVGCDDNLFVDNDGSYSPNIAFEATFSRGNIFRNNIASHCNYGFWLGFSRSTTVEHNQINRNQQAGIATENGYDFQVRVNCIESNQYGILLWSKRIPAFEHGAPANTTSYQWLIESNIFRKNQTAIRIASNQDHGIRPLPASGECGFPAPIPHHHVIIKNHIEGNIFPFQFEKIEPPDIQNNQLINNMNG